MKMTQDKIFLIRKELRGLKAINLFVSLCAGESIASRCTVYDALTPARFTLSSTLHRVIVRRAVRYLKEQFGLLTEWDIEEMLPESLLAVSEG